MKVLFISNDPLLFVPDSAVRARMHVYADAIGELHIMSRAPVASEVHEENLHIYGVRAGKLMGLRTFARTAQALIVAQGIEVVSAQDPFEYGLVALWASRGTPAKLHIQVHTDFLSRWFTRDGNLRAPRVRMPLLNAVRRNVAGFVLPHAAGIRTVSKRVRDSLVNRYGSRIPEPSVIPIAISDVERDAVALPPHLFTFALITVSRLEPEKRIEDIIAALARVALHYPGVGLVIVGEGRERARLTRAVRKLGLTDRVLFLGARTDAVGLMKSAQAYIQASAYEGYGVTLIEAACARLPIITTDVGIVGEVFTGYDDVLSVPVGDPAALATHIMGLVEDMQARQMLVRSAEQAARAHLVGVKEQAERIAHDLARVLEKTS